MAICQKWRPNLDGSTIPKVCGVPKSDQIWLKILSKMDLNLEVAFFAFEIDLLRLPEVFWSHCRRKYPQRHPWVTSVNPFWKAIWSIWGRFSDHFHLPGKTSKMSCARNLCKHAAPDSGFSTAIGQLTSHFAWFVPCPTPCTCSGRSKRRCDG